MYEDFEYKTLKLDKIRLDDRNPRIVTQQKLSSQDAIVEYFFQHEGLGNFLAKIVSETRNRGAEHPYVVAEADGFVVIEGNTRIATYKLLAGLLKAPKEFQTKVPKISDEFRKSLLEIDCAIAPSRDAMLPIMANSHFGVGDKNRWGYLGSRKAVYDELKLGKDVDALSTIFRRTKSEIVDYIIEYQLYLEALKLTWTKAERDALLDPAVEFNPPVRFLQSSGHRTSVGITFDRTNLAVKFDNDLAKSKFHHLLRKLVIEHGNGLKATSGYDEVFKTFKASDNSEDDKHKDNSGGEDKSEAEENSTDKQESGNKDDQKKSHLKPGTLFNYPVNSGNLVVQKLMGEAAKISCNSYPASATALLRSLLEAILKNIVQVQKANPSGTMLSLEKALDICLSNTVNLLPDDKKILKEFKNQHLDYVNMGTHATIIPQPTRTFGVRDCIDQFVKRNA